MKNYLTNIIQSDSSVVAALKVLNEGHPSLTIFVNNSNNRMVGTLTDGDIRRGLIKGLTLNDPISDFMTTNFSYIKKKYDIKEIKRFRDNEIKLLPELNDKMEIVKIHDLQKKKNILPLQCVIMAGGRGERLRPLTDTIPKPMLPLGGKPIIEHNIERLNLYGIDNIYISIKYLGDIIVDYFGDGSSRNLNINYIKEEKPLGTAGALSLVEKFDSEYILLMNSDLFTDIDLEDLYLQILEQDAAMGIASIPHTHKIPYAIFEEKNNIITNFKEKPIFTNYANAGIYIFKRELIKLIPKNTFFNITDLLEIILKLNYKVIHNPIIGYWIDIGQPQDYLNAQEIIKHISNGH